MRITAIQQAKKNVERVHLFLDNTYWVSLNKTQLIELQLFKEKEIFDEDRKMIEHQSAIGTLISKSIQFIALRPRSKKEVVDYLMYKCRIDSETTELVLQKLIELHYVDDTEFADWYINQRLTFGVHGTQKIKAELIAKGVSLTIIAEKLSALSKGTLEEQVSKAHTYIQKHLSSKDLKNTFTLTAAVYRKLFAKGFDNTIIELVTKRLIHSEDNHANGFASA